VALACHYRVASDTAKLGLPEVTLGLIPGAGGTVRLPRLIGVEAALDMILLGKPVNADTALVSGLVDKVSSEDLLREAGKLAVKVAEEPLRESLIVRDVIAIAEPGAWETKLDTVKAKYADRQAQLAAIQSVENTLVLPAHDALAQERALFIELRDGSQSAALRHVFMAERSAMKMDKLKNTMPSELNCVGVIGGGTMGAGISAACLLAGLSVIMIERDTKSLDEGQKRVKATLDGSLKRNIISEQKHQQLLESFKGDTRYSALAIADLVVEAVFEDISVKQLVFAELDQHTKPGTVLASNTSYIDINQIAKSVKNPARVIGLHFFSPAHIMKLVELVVTDQICDQMYKFQ
jgi:3-hydroxyacyl-CoA dehydrogenase